MTPLLARGVLIDEYLVYRLRQVDVKAEHFERQVQRTEQERDNWEKKYEVSRARFARDRDRDGLHMLIHLRRNPKRSTGSRRRNSTSSSIPCRVSDWCGRYLVCYTSPRVTYHSRCPTRTQFYLFPLIFIHGDRLYLQTAYLVVPSMTTSIYVVCAVPCRLDNRICLQDIADLGVTTVG